MTEVSLLQYRVREDEDVAVSRYWDEERRFIQSRLGDYFSAEKSYAGFDQNVKERRGLRGYGDIAIHNAFLLIAADIDEVGLQHAEWTMRFAEAAISSDDYGSYAGCSRAIGHGTNYRNLFYAKWLLRLPDRSDAAGKWLQHVRDLCSELKVAQGEATEDEQELMVWQCVVPFIVAGDITEARDIYRTLSPCADGNSKRIKKKIRSIMDFLPVFFELSSDARFPREPLLKKANEFLYDLSGWGHEEPNLRGTLWRRLVIEQHVAVACVVARHFNGPQELGEVIKSIRCPVIAIRQ